VQKGNTKIILDAYNANPSSMKAAIENFARATGTNKMLVLGAMAELGDNSLQEHETIVQEILKHNWNRVILVGGDFLKLKHPFESFATAIEAGASLQGKTDHAFLLVKGSRSMQMEKVLEHI
jgi:UDP-N-acetylmuramoyl-tripeptide--D-alanyl-D-alanine ligase